MMGMSSGLNVKREAQRKKLRDLIWLNVTGFSIIITPIKIVIAVL